ncbi:MAG: biotin transporter BioY [candidate division WOR-3 bacterium]
MAGHGYPSSAVLVRQSRICGKTAVSELLGIAAGAGLIALLSQVRIVLPCTPVPITGQTIAVLLIPAALGCVRGTLAVLVYLAAGISGLPVFSGSGVGWAHLLGPTGGYLTGFVAAALLVGRAKDMNLLRSWSSRLIILLLANLIIYLFGIGWLARFVGFPKAVALGVLPFLPGDGLKVFLTAALLRLYTLRYPAR